MKGLIFIITLLMKASLIIAQTNETKIETYFGVYYFLDKFDSDNIATLFIDENGFSIFFSWSELIDPTNSGGDVNIVLPNYKGRFQLTSTQTAMFSDETNDLTILVNLSDTLSLHVLKSTMAIFINQDFMRFQAYFSKNLGNDKYAFSKVKWKYNFFGMPESSRVMDDDFFYFYNIEGELIEKVKDTAKIHPYSRRFFD